MELRISHFRHVQINCVRPNQHLTSVYVNNEFFFLPKQGKILKNVPHTEHNIDT